jgi:hypothetical protein
VQPNLPVLLDPIIKARRPPPLGEKDHADRLTKVVQLQAARADAGEDAGVGHGGDGDTLRARAEDEVGVCGGAEGVADDEEGDVFGGGVGEDGIGVGLDEFAVGEEDGAAVVGFLEAGELVTCTLGAQ